MQIYNYAMQDILRKEKIANHLHFIKLGSAIAISLGVLSTGAFKLITQPDILSSSEDVMANQNNEGQIMALLFNANMPEDKPIEVNDSQNNDIIVLSVSDFLTGQAFKKSSSNHQSISDNNKNGIKKYNANLETAFKHNSFFRLLCLTEGFSNIFYKDNIGVAAIFGWNPTRNSEEFNEYILNKVPMDNKVKAAILNLSNKGEKVKAVPQDIANYQFTPSQVLKMTESMKGFYEDVFLKVLTKKMDDKHFSDAQKQKVIDGYHHLPDNQRAVLIHMAYKLGEPNLVKYNGFFNRFLVYAVKPTQVNKTLVANQFSYYYTKDKKRYHDTQTEEIHNEYFKTGETNELTDKVKNVRTKMAEAFSLNKGKYYKS
jgi:hypothetical protein